MQQLTPEGQRIVDELAQRHGFSLDATRHMLLAVIAGRGTMAQFNHPEFGGSGQWMAGGMIMLGDMFNHGLKMRVDQLCTELSNLLAQQPNWTQSQSGSYQSQQQGGYTEPLRSAGPNAWLERDPEAEFWPPELGRPNAVGSQNQMHYAYFAGARRLVVKTGSQVWVYDTLDHQIGGFAQQQGGNTGIQFNSQYGLVDLSSLPVVSRNGQAVAAAPSSPAPQPQPQPQAVQGDWQPPAASASTDPSALLAAIERLGDLHQKGLLTEEEFAKKKSELLARL